MDTRIFVTLVSFALGAFACSSTTEAEPGGSGGPGAGPGGGGAGGASSNEVASCKESCNKMKFFGCNSAEQQAACYDECTQASSDQIELFNACAGTSICDPECRTSITPKPAPGAPAPVGGGGATPSSCATACEKLVSCSFIKVGDRTACVGECEKEAYQYQIDCVNNTACNNMQTACGGGAGGGGGGGGGGDAASIAQCQGACDQLLFMECIEAPAQSACRDKCTSKTATQRDAFSACVLASTGACTKGNACYTAF